jgi:hypothetical protein
VYVIQTGVFLQRKTLCFTTGYAARGQVQGLDGERSRHRRAVGERWCQRVMFPGIPGGKTLQKAMEAMAHL